MLVRVTNHTTLPMAALLSRLSWHFGQNGDAFAQLQKDTYAGVQDLILHVAFIIKLPCMGLLEITAGAFGANTEERTASAVTREWEGPDRLEQLACFFADKGKHPEEEDRNDPIPAALPKEEEPAWKSAATAFDIVAFKRNGHITNLMCVLDVRYNREREEYGYDCRAYNPRTDEYAPLEQETYSFWESELYAVMDSSQLKACRELFDQLGPFVIDRRVPEASITDDTMGVHANGNFPPEGFFTVRVPFLFTQIMKE